MIENPGHELRIAWAKLTQNRPNYLRKAIGQETGGHISPLGAYNAGTDRFLVLDVARYKYPPFWVTAADLYAALNTKVSGNRTRGFVLVRRSRECRLAAVR